MTRELAGLGSHGNWGFKPGLAFCGEEDPRHRCSWATGAAEVCFAPCLPCLVSRIWSSPDFRRQVTSWTKRKRMSTRRSGWHSRPAIFSPVCGTSDSATGHPTTAARIPAVDDAWLGKSMHLCIFAFDADDCGFEVARWRPSTTTPATSMLM